MTNSIQTEVVDIPSNAVALRPSMAVGHAMGVNEIVAQVKLIQDVMHQVMKDGEHYGTIPGCGNKKTLLQPGAQKLTMTFRLAPEYEIQEVNLDRGHKEYRVTCTLKSMGNGSFVGQGVGCCSSMESKYRFRGGARKCPECGKETIIKGKAEYGGGWICLTPETPILYADMKWRPIGQAKPGDSIIGFDEYPANGSQRRKLRPSLVKEVWWNRKPSMRLITDSGEIRTTGEHRWLEHHRPIGHLGHWGDPWKQTDRLVVGNPLRFIGMHETLPTTDCYRRGYLAGMTDSDGTMRYDPTLTRRSQPIPYWRVALQARDEIALGRLVAYLSHFGIEAWTRPFCGSVNPLHSPMQKVEIRAVGRLSQLHTLIQPMETRDFMRGYLAGFFDGDGSGDSGRITIYNTKAHKLEKLSACGRALGFDLRQQAGTPTLVRLQGGVRESMRFISLVSPALLRKAPMYGVSMQYDPATIEAIESGPVCDVVDIQTSTGTYFAAGHASHNCFSKKGGCGQKWADGAQEIESQEMGRIENDNPADTFNTVLKMAKKRAFVDATITATAASDIFTQDSGDDEEPENGHKAPANAPTAHSKHSPPTQTSSKPSQTAPAPFPTVDQREKMIKELKAEVGGTNRDLVTEYFRKAGALLPTENIEDLDLCFVPSMASQMRALGSSLAAFGTGERAELAFPKHDEPEKKTTKKAPKQEELAVQPARPASPASAVDGVRSWEDFPVPFGKSAGMRLGDVPKNSLFGFWANFEVKTEYNGKPISKEKIAKDQTFRDMLDAAGEHHEFKKPEQDEVPF